MCDKKGGAMKREVICNSRAKKKIAPGEAGQGIRVLPNLFTALKRKIMKLSFFLIYSNHVIS